jgi:2-oxoglutarate ferredoxin oxidoreductase subunit gamma
MRTEIRLTGSGGQGLITAARILAKAALLDGMNTLQSQVYGAEARGGATKSEVVIADRNIYYPEVLQPDITAIMTKASYQKYGHRVKPSSLRIIDTFMVPEYTEIPEITTLGLPFTSFADTQFHTKLVTNMILMGYIVAKTKIVKSETFFTALGDFFNSEKLGKNKEAFSFGQTLLGKETQII